MPEQTASLRAAGVDVAFGVTTVLRDASLGLRRGEVTALVGPNGSGKSTLLRTMSRLIEPARGVVSVGSDVPDVRALSARAFAREVTLLSQQRPTPTGLTVRDVVEFGRHPYRSRWRGTDPDGPAAVAHALHVTGLADLADALLETLSGGQLQRAWFASALAQQTTVLLLDEPTNHLDLRYQVEVLELIRSLADEHGVAIGVVLHDLNHAADIADRVVVLDRGRVVAEGHPDETLTTPLLTAVWELPVEAARNDSGDLEIRTRRVRKRRLTT